MKWFRIALGLLALICSTRAEGEAADALGLSPNEREEMAQSGEKHEFQAEVNRLMDIIVNSLYSNREIFLRELISNAADASDKIRYASLQDSNLLGEGDLADLDIRIRADAETKTITITDKGVGMTKEDLVRNLGIVAKSGTTEFLEAAKSSSDDLSLIGQFGVGFYSVYLVADKVTVCSKHNSDKQHIWESTANSVFTVSEDPRGDTLGRGTSITLHLKEDAEEFLKEDKLSAIVSRYSQFVNVPILLEVEKTITKEVPIEEEATAEGEEEDDVEVSEEEDADAVDEDDEPETKTIQEKVKEWKRVNEAKALWTRNPKDITEEEYKEFFNTLTKDKFPDGHLDHTHFVAEGEITFKSLLYIPKKADPNAYSDMFQVSKTGVHLYVRRVLISDEFEDFLPRYMNFVRGVVESDDLPLNVSRETLAQSRVLKVMSKKLVRKVLEMLRKMSEAAEGEEAEGSDDGDDTKMEDAGKAYEDFWKEHGKSIKFGVMDDRKNKSKLAKLLRYSTSKSNDKEVSLQSYVDRMSNDQKYIYYITGENLEKVKNSPFLEKITSKGFEVVYMVDPLDEYVVNAMTEFEGVELQSVTKEGLKLGDEERKSLKKLKEEYKPLTEWFHSTYSSRIEKVAVSNRLGQSPCVLVTGQYGITANMHRIMSSSTLGGNNQYGHMAKKTLEINVLHPIMQAIYQKVVAGEDSQSLKDVADMLLDSALLQSGFEIDDVASFNKRMARIISVGLDLDPEAPIDEDVGELGQGEDSTEDVDAAGDEDSTHHHEEL